jgi:5,10-methylenetetrahydrofolate reductase
VEWSRQLASIHSLLRPTHFVLPDLPHVINASLRNEFYEAISRNNRIVTIQASRYTPDSLEQVIREKEGSVDKFLIVGGNAKNHTSPSSVEAIKTARHFTENEVWATANPNDRKSIDSVLSKLDAGATGIITQPLLSYPAIEILEGYPREGGVVYIAGLALPKTSKGLLFWKDLLGQPDLLGDSLFEKHLDYFLHQGDSLTWAQKEVMRLQGANIDGIHFMPMNNTADLISLLTNPTMTY